MRSLRRSTAPAVIAAGALAALALALPAGAAPKPVTVKLGEFFYRPAVVTVSPGQKVVFVNVGKIAHTVADTTAKGDILSKQIVPHELKPGARQVVSFAKPGVVYYLCTFHPTLMKGKIVVR